MKKPLRVIFLRPTKYEHYGFAQRFRFAFLPSAALTHMAALTPKEVDGHPVEVHLIDEYAHTDLEYLELLRGSNDRITVLALNSVMSCQFNRALDLGAFAMSRGIQHVVMGGPHPATCDTSMVQNKGISFCQVEAEAAWETILHDAVRGQLEPVYSGNRWVGSLASATPIEPMPKEHRHRYAFPMASIYPTRGCPYDCTFCSVIKLAGRNMRSQPIEVTLESIRRCKEAGIQQLFLVSDNFNKIPDVDKLLIGMIDRKLQMPFIVQADCELVQHPDLIELMARAGCSDCFVGVERFRRGDLKLLGKHHNHPDTYARLLAGLRRHGIESVIGSIIGFPDEDEDSLLQNRRDVAELGPDTVLFSILTPLPGARLYDEFMEKGILVEPNLDYYDIDHLVFQHATYSPAEMKRVQEREHAAFHGPRNGLTQFFKRTSSLNWKEPMKAAKRWFRPLSLQLSFPLLKKMGVEVHPNGALQRRLDSAHDYIHLRRKYFGFDMAPLPKSLALTADDEKLNRSAKLITRSKSLPIAS